MSQLPLSIPRAKETREFHEQPFDFLARTRAKLGDMFVIRDDGPMFSRAPECNGTIAVFGSALHQAVLGDIDRFGLPISAAEHLSLPQALVNLNRGLHSMRGEQHAQQQRVLSQLLSERSLDDQQSAIGEALETFVAGWRSGQSISLLSEMRQLALQMSTRMFLGVGYAASSELGMLLQAYFHLRREAAAPFTSLGDSSRSELVTLGISLDRELRRYVSWCRKQSANSADGLLTKLAGLELDSGVRFSEDETVAHINVLFMSSNEPIAVSLTWMLLLLSQLPDLRRELREELEQASPAKAPPTATKSALLDSVINETLRLLTPNALMARVTTEPALLEGVLLPAGCEILLCPFLAHRDANRFPQPSEFRLSRWRGTRPSPFEYFPFGAGGHSCVGRQLAIYIIRAALTSLLRRYEFVLAGDQEIDWRIDIMFMPRNEPTMTVGLPGTTNLRAGKLLGPVSELVTLDTYNS